jgi:hypothetical protein
VDRNDYDPGASWPHDGPNHTATEFNIIRFLLALAEGGFFLPSSYTCALVPLRGSRQGDRDALTAIPVSTCARPLGC